LKYFGVAGNSYWKLSSLPGVSLGPHGAYFRMRKLKSQVAKVSTVASVMGDK